jgi:hypothetical protein
MRHVMTKRAVDRRGLILRCALALAVPVGTLMLSSIAAAQPPGVGGGPAINRPTTSPYLNLFNRGNQGFGGPALNRALNYYRFVQPEQQLRRYSGQLGQQVTSLEQSLTSQGLLPDGSRALSGTGHTTSFLNLGGYFPNSQTGARSSARR